MTELDVALFKEEMKRHSRMFDKYPTEELLDDYWEILKDMPVSEFVDASHRHRRQGRFFPKPVDFLGDTGPKVADEEMRQRIEDHVRAYRQTTDDRTRESRQRKLADLGLGPMDLTLRVYEQVDRYMRELRRVR